MSDYWVEASTTPERIEAALRGLLRESHAADAALVPARVLNLIVVCDRAWRGEVVGRLDRIGRYHPSRTILCTVEEGRTQLDARVLVGGENQGAGNIGVLRETIELRVGPTHLSWLDSIIDPIIVSELPSLLWSPHSYDQAVESLLRLIDVILIDTDDPTYFDGAGVALRRAEQLLQSHVRVVDLAWLRTIPWRQRLAGSFDEPQRRDALAGLKRVFVRFEAGSIVSASLLAGWLASRLGWTPGLLTPGVAGTFTADGRKQNGSRVSFEFVPVPQAARGIGGVTVTGSLGFSLALDRAMGGMVVREQRAASRPRQWQMLGASRGEGGILGEGVRQALLHDHTYGPALTAARSFNP
jgi:glucose-6-phosphate dehydrogenase assembly protein OpcA